MINVKKIVEKLKEYLNIRTDDQLAEYFGVHYSTVSGWKKRNSISVELIMEKVKDIDMNWLLYDHDIEKTNDYSKVKEKSHTLREGEVEYLEDEVMGNLLDIDVYDIPAYGSETGLVNFDEYPHSTKKLYLGFNIDVKYLKGVKLTGNSMEGSGICNGDYVFYRTDDKAYNNRQVLAKLNGAFIVKTLKKENGSITLISDYAEGSRKLEVMDDDHLEIIGIVVAVLSFR